MEMKCDECGNIQEAKLKRIDTAMGLEHYYLQCERCYVRTTSYVTDKKLRRLIASNARIREGKGANDKELEEWEANNKEIESRMKELTNKHKF